MGKFSLYISSPHTRLTSSTFPVLMSTQTSLSAKIADYRAKFQIPEPHEPRSAEVEEHMLHLIQFHRNEGTKEDALLAELIATRTYHSMALTSKAKLRADNDKLKTQKEKLETENEQLKAEIEKLKAERI